MLNCVKTATRNHEQPWTSADHQRRWPARQAKASAHPQLLRDEAVLGPSRIDGSRPTKPEAHGSNLVRAMGLSSCAGRRDCRSIGRLTRIAGCRAVAAARCDAEDVPQSPGQLFGQAPHLVRGRALVVESF